MSIANTAGPAPAPQKTGDDGRRGKLVVLLVVLLIVIALLTTILIIYLINPGPLPDLLPLDLDYEPHYLFSIYEVDQPVGIAVSPDDELIYVTESGGERLVKIFDRGGELLGSFFAAGTNASSRSPVYLDTDTAGRVYVTDRLQHAIMVFDSRGIHVDTILDPNDTLSEYVASSECGLEQGTSFSFNAFEGLVRCTPPGGSEQTLHFPPVDNWSPLGIRIDDADKFLVTDVLAEAHRVHVGESSAGPAQLSLAALTGGATGQEPDQLLFPNVAVSDSQGRVYVTDGNNGRVSIWDPQGRHLGSIGTGGGAGALSLPRGATVTDRDRLHVVDAVGQDIKVYDVSGGEPEFLFSFGDEGLEDGEFRFPGDVAVDSTGRLYVTDRENNRIQVWSY